MVIQYAQSFYFISSWQNWIRSVNYERIDWQRIVQFLWFGMIIFNLENLELKIIIYLEKLCIFEDFFDFCWFHLSCEENDTVCFFQIFYFLVCCHFLNQICILDYFIESHVDRLSVDWGSCESQVVNQTQRSLASQSLEHFHKIIHLLIKQGIFKIYLVFFYI